VVQLRVRRSLEVELQFPSIEELRRRMRSTTRSARGLASVRSTQDLGFVQCAHQVSSNGSVPAQHVMMRRNFRIVEDGNKAMEELGEQGFRTSYDSERAHRWWATPCPSLPRGAATRCGP
jgi:hypothetical protein